MKTGVSNLVESVLRRFDNEDCALVLRKRVFMMRWFPYRTYLLIDREGNRVHDPKAEWHWPNVISRRWRVISRRWR